MKVYVITQGEYSDYGIVAVKLDKTEAETLAHAVSGKYYPAYVEEYDTDDFQIIDESKTVYEIDFLKSGSVKRWRNCPNQRVVNNQCVCLEIYHNMIRVVVVANNEQSAIKIAAEKRAEYLAKKNGL